jgi:hypothetical protein
MALPQSALSELLDAIRAGDSDRPSDVDGLAYIPYDATGG